MLDWVIVCVDCRVAIRQNPHGFGTHPSPCWSETLNRRISQTRGNWRHCWVVSQQSTFLREKYMNVMYRHFKWKVLTCASLIKYFTAVARFRASALSRIEPATQLVIYYWNWQMILSTVNGRFKDTLLPSRRMGVMLSCSVLCFDSREGWIYSISRTLSYNVVSIRVSCRASSMGSMSSNFSFFEDLGRIGVGACEGNIICVALIGHPPCCLWGEIS